MERRRLVGCCCYFFFSILFLFYRPALVTALNGFFFKCLGCFFLIGTANRKVRNIKNVARFSSVMYRVYRVLPSSTGIYGFFLPTCT